MLYLESIKYNILLLILSLLSKSLNFDSIDRSNKKWEEAAGVEPAACQQ
jgi:hypothetical protein